MITKRTQRALAVGWLASSIALDCFVIYVPAAGADSSSAELVALLLILFGPSVALGLLVRSVWMYLLPAIAFAIFLVVAVVLNALADPHVNDGQAGLWPVFANVYRAGAIGLGHGLALVPWASMGKCARHPIRCFRDRRRRAP